MTIAFSQHFFYNYYDLQVMNFHGWNIVPPYAPTFHRTQSISTYTVPSNSFLQFSLYEGQSFELYPLKQDFPMFLRQRFQTHRAHDINSYFFEAVPPSSFNPIFCKNISPLSELLHPPPHHRRTSSWDPFLSLPSRSPTKSSSGQDPSRILLALFIDAIW